MTALCNWSYPRGKLEVDFSNAKNFTGRRDLVKEEEKKRCKESKGLFDKRQLGKHQIDKNGRPKHFKVQSTNDALSFPTSEPETCKMLFSM
jgi:hypothetical protein